jgi:3-phosphoshikimate 1-carboxyvinyltransferase
VVVGLDNPGDEGMRIEGLGNVDTLRLSGVITTNIDHRIAMSFLIAGMVGSAPVTVDDDSAIATSFPDFVPLMRVLGAGFEGRVGEDAAS